MRRAPLSPFHFGAMALAALMAVASCSHYYKVEKAPAALQRPDSTLTANPHRYFILRSGFNAYHMEDMSLSPDRTTVTCRLEVLPEEHRLHLRNGRGGHLRYKASAPEEAVLSEIHLYIPQDTTAVSGHVYSFSLGKVEKLEILQKDKGRTTMSYVLGGLGIGAGVFAIVAVIVVATKSSCPFVSAYDGKNMLLQGEIYGGAIYPQLQRDDYIQLKMAPLRNGNLQVKISNELKERQYTDLAELMVVTHDKNVRVLVDETGRYYSIGKPVAPFTATAAGKDVLSAVRESNDDRAFAFDDTLAPKGDNQLKLSFKRPAGVRKAKLVLRLKNSYWMDYVYGKMAEGFGSFYTRFIEQQHTKPVEDLKRWVKEQQIPLKVEMLTPDGPQIAGSITTFGPVANRETVIPLDLPANADDRIDVQLSCGFMFWELDYAALDFSDDADLQVTVLPPVKAVDETGKNVTSLLTMADGKYLEQPVPGNAADIEYRFTPTQDRSKVQDFVLHARGYYEHVRDFKGTANIRFLEQFRHADALSAFSRRLYLNALDTNTKSPMYAEVK